MHGTLIRAHFSARSHIDGSGSPGRFFVANELKAMLAHLVATYDVKLEDGGARPADVLFGQNVIPNQKAELLFRKRST